MNESTWLSCTQLWDLMRFHAKDLSNRKMRLFACACTRRIWPLLTRETVREAVQTAERYADGEASRDDLRAGWLAVRKALSVAPLNTRWEDALMAALNASSEEMNSSLAANAARSAAVALDGKWRKRANPMLATDRERLRDGSPEEQAYQCGLLRDLFPFESVEAEPAWLAWDGGQVVSLARAIHEEDRWQDMPVLADALEEAGCGAERILAHCRGAGPHVRGCWVVDALLGRE